MCRVQCLDKLDAVGSHARSGRRQRRKPRDAHSSSFRRQCIGYRLMPHDRHSMWRLECSIVTLEAILFYFFGLAAVVASLLVIAQRNPIYSVLLLIASFAALSGLYVLLQAPFVAAIQIIVYAGAVTVLCLSVVVLLNPGWEEGEHDDQARSWPMR